MVFFSPTWLPLASCITATLFASTASANTVFEVRYFQNRPDAKLRTTRYWACTKLRPYVDLCEQPRGRWEKDVFPRKMAVVPVDSKASTKGLEPRTFTKLHGPMRKAGKGGFPFSRLVTSLSFTMIDKARFQPLPQLPQELNDEIQMHGVRKHGDLQAAPIVSLEGKDGVVVPDTFVIMTDGKARKFKAPKIVQSADWTSPSEIRDGSDPNTRLVAAFTDPELSDEAFIKFLMDQFKVKEMSSS